MRCQQAEKLILLDQSSELGDADRSTLREHLKTCSDCRGYEKLISGLESTIGEQASAKPPEATRELVMEMARKRQTPRDIRRTHSMGIWRPILASAAGLCLVLTGWLIFQRHQMEQELLLTDNISLQAAQEIVEELDNGDTQLDTLLMETTRDDDLALDYFVGSNI